MESPVEAQMRFERFRTECAALQDPVDQVEHVELVDLLRELVVLQRRIDARIAYLSERTGG